jgi:hypothetical protein
MRRGRWPTAGIGYKMNNQCPTTTVHEGRGRAQEGHKVEGHGSDSGSEKGRVGGGKVVMSKRGQKQRPFLKLFGYKEHVANDGPHDAKHDDG